MKNEIVSSLIVATIVTILVLFNTPRDSIKERNVKKIGIKSFMISFGVSFVIFYFLGDTSSDDVLENIIKGEPDF